MLDWIFDVLGELLAAALGKLGIRGWVVLVLIVALIICVCLYLN